MHGGECPAHMFFLTSPIPIAISCADIVDAWIRGTAFKARTCNLGYVQRSFVTLNGGPSIYFTFDFLTQPPARLPAHGIFLYIKSTFVNKIYFY